MWPRSSGIDAAKQESVDWPKVLAFTDALASHDWKASHPQQRILYASDSVYSACLRTLTQFLTTSKDAGLKRDVWRTIKKLLKICTILRADEGPRWKEGDDLIIHALNDNDGMAIDVLIQYILWSNSVAGRPKSQQMDVEAWDIFERILSQTMDEPSISSTAIGLRFINLYSQFNDWTKANLDIIFPDGNRHRKSWKMAWEGYIVATNLCRDPYVDLRPQYNIAIRKIDGLSEHAKNRTIEHILFAYIHGLESLEISLLKQLVTIAKPEVRSTILRIMGIYLSSMPKKPESEEVGETIIRCREYWEWRLKELEPLGEGKGATIAKELGMVTDLFISLPSLNEEDLFRLRKTVELTGGHVERPQEIIEKLRETLLC